MVVQSSGSRSGPPPFRAVLQPHRSLNSAGFVMLMGIIGVVSLIIGTGFLLLGAWPVFGFFGLDVALVYVAFRLSYRSGRLYETVDLADGQLDVARVHPSGRREAWSLVPYWVRVELTRAEAGTCELELASHGQRLSLARFLPVPEKVEFAGALSRALAAYRTA